jgi:hypothetical protein
VISFIATNIRSTATRIISHHEIVRDTAHAETYVDVADMFPSLLLAIAKRREKVEREGVEVTPCDLYLNGNVNMTALLVGMATSRRAAVYVLPPDHPSSKPEQSLSGTPVVEPEKQGIREVALRMNSALVVTHRVRVGDINWYRHLAIPESIYLRLATISREEGVSQTAQWTRDLNGTLSWFEEIAKGMPTVRTTVKCSYAHLRGLMRTVSHLLTCETCDPL